MPGPVFFNTSPACLRQPDERCRPACTNRLPAYTMRLVRLCSRHRLFTELALDTHTLPNTVSTKSSCNEGSLSAEPMAEPPELLGSWLLGRFLGS